MAITSASTQADIIAQYLDNLGYDHALSESSCRLFITACRALLVMHPSEWLHSRHRITYDAELWERQLRSAEQWLAANTSTVGAGSIKHLAFGSDFR